MEAAAVTVLTMMEKLESAVPCQKSFELATLSPPSALTLKSLFRDLFTKLSTKTRLVQKTLTIIGPFKHFKSVFGTLNFQQKSELG